MPPALFRFGFIRHTVASTVFAWGGPGPGSGSAANSSFAHRVLICRTAIRAGCRIFRAEFGAVCVAALLVLADCRLPFYLRHAFAVLPHLYILLGPAIIADAGI